MVSSSRAPGNCRGSQRPRQEQAAMEGSAKLIVSANCNLFVKLMGNHFVAELNFYRKSLGCLVSISSLQLCHRLAAHIFMIAGEL